MNNRYCDNKIQEVSYLTINILLIGLFILSISLCTSVYAFIRADIFQDRVFPVIGFFGVGYYFLIGISYIFNGRKILKEIEFYEHKIALKNCFNQVFDLELADISEISFHRFKWFLGIKPKDFRENKNFFFIHLKNGKSFAIGSNMENIQTLKGKFIEPT